MTDPAWFTPMQIHDYFELCCVSEGSGWFILDGAKHAAEAGDVFVTKPHEVHCGGASGQGQFTLYSLGFRFQELTPLENGYYLLGQSRVVRDSSGAVAQWCERLLRECEHEAPYGPIMAKSVLTALLTDILRCYANHEPARENAADPIPSYIKSALSIIHAQSASRIPDVIRQAGVSRAHFDRNFKRLLGVTPGGYLRRLLMDRAKRALLETDRSVTEIADLLDFESVQAFCLFFKRQSGASPLQFRRQAARIAAPGSDQEEEC
nr:AraC family transcriptional regulator [Paenibacillus sacheonensis]